MDSDTVITNMQTKLMAAYLAIVGAASRAIPWQSIIAAIMSILTGCLNPTPAHVRTQLEKPLVRMRILAMLHQQRIYGFDAENVLAAFEKTMHEATDEEVGSLIKASQEA